jgi:DNA end-binding protein Ku
VGTIWKGSISFGLVSIPVRLEPAVRERSLRFHQLHAKDSGRVRYRKFCEVCGKELTAEEIVRGYEYARGEHVVLTEEELARASTSPKTVEILKFIPEDQVDPVFFRAPYYLTPEPLGAKPYRLLREAMTALGRVALARVYLREKEHPAVIRASGSALVLETMYWPDEVLKPALAEGEVEVRPQELQMARSLVETMTEEFRPSELKDSYRERLEALVERKVKGLLPPPPPVEEERARVVDLMEALKVSIERARAEREAREGRKRAAAAERRGRSA